MATPSEPGCWIYAPNGCAQDATYNSWTRDAWGESNLDTGLDEAGCLKRASDFDANCPTTGTVAQFNRGEEIILRHFCAEEVFSC